MSELTAVGKYIHYWWPEVPTWATTALFFVVVNAINLANVKAFGEARVQSSRSSRWWRSSA
ncbi:hypothetical protein ACPA9J_10730 [Pseudomonas aeruginosa]